jgi:uncharacterized Tic20 family protein
MRPLNRPPRQDQPHNTSHHKKNRPSDGVTKRRIRDDRFFAALCHAGIFMGMWGRVSAAVMWAFRKDRYRVLRFQGAQALMYQFIAQTVFLAAAIAGVYWAGDFSLPSKSAMSALRDLATATWLAGLGQVSFLPLTIAYALFGFVASLLLLLSLFGLEPSYPVVGALTRRSLGLRSSSPAKTADEEAPAPAEKNKQAEEKKEEAVTGKEERT